MNKWLQFEEIINVFYFVLQTLSYKHQFSFAQGKILSLLLFVNEMFDCAIKIKDMPSMLSLNLFSIKDKIKLYFHIWVSEEQYC